MSTGEADKEIARNAQELLSTLQENCPEKVWQELNFELDQGGGGSERSLKVSPKILIAAGALVVVAAVAVIFIEKHNSEDKAAVERKVQPAPVVPPQPKPTPTPTVVPVAVHDTVVPKKHDTVIPQVTHVTTPEVQHETPKRDTQRARQQQQVQQQVRQQRQEQQQHTAQTQVNNSRQADSARMAKYQAQELLRRNRINARRNRAHSPAADSLKSHFYHEVSKEPFGTDTAR